MKLRQVGFGALAVVLLAVTADNAFAQPGRKEMNGAGTYSQKGEDAPIHTVIEAFLLEASSWYELPEEYPAFCLTFGIDASWPSAAALGIGGSRILEEYHERAMAFDPQGVRWEQDPDEWKQEELGRVFGEIFEGLREDGLRYRLGIFMRVIAIHVGPKLTTYSDEPFVESEAAAESERFWSAMATTSGEAQKILRKGGRG